MAVIEKVNATHFKFMCPGCRRVHIFDNSWEFNGDFNKPTIHPSIKVTGTIPITDEEHEKIMNGEKVTPKPFVCHSFVRIGEIQFLSDCTHELAGQTVMLEEYN